MTPVGFGVSCSLLTEHKCMPARSIGPDSALNLFRCHAPLLVNNSTNNKDCKKHDNLISREKGEEKVCMIFKDNNMLWTIKEKNGPGKLDFD